MRLLITGGSGFIGSSLTQAALDEGHEVLVLDHRPADLPDPRATYLLADLRALDDAVLAGIDAVVHLAAKVGPRTSVVRPAHARDPLTLLALRINGAELHPDHGYPLRLIAPNRPGVEQTKWVNKVVVL